MEGRPAGSTPIDRLAALYDELVPVVYGYCRARLPQHDAEDVTADVFRAAAEVLCDDGTAQLSRSWFLTAARHRIIDRWRRQERWRPRLVLIGASQPTAVTHEFEERDHVLAALDQLPPPQRAVLVLHHVEGRPVREVADLLGRSPTAVQSLLARARRALHAALQAADGPVSTELTRLGGGT